MLPQRAHCTENTLGNARRTSSDGIFRDIFLGWYKGPRRVFGGRFLGSQAHGLEKSGKHATPCTCGRANEKLWDPRRVGRLRSHVSTWRSFATAYRPSTARTMAMMPVLTTVGSCSQDVTISARSGSFCTESGKQTGKTLSIKDFKVRRTENKPRVTPTYGSVQLASSPPGYSKPWNPWMKLKQSSIFTSLLG